MFCVLPSPQSIAAVCVSATPGSLKLTVSPLAAPRSRGGPCRKSVTVGGTFTTSTVADTADSPRVRRLTFTV